MVRYIDCFLEYWGSIPSTHIAAYNYLKLQYLGIQWYLLVPEALGALGAQTYNRVKHLYI